MAALPLSLQTLSNATSAGVLRFADASPASSTLLYFRIGVDPKVVPA